MNTISTAAYAAVAATASKGLLVAVAITDMKMHTKAVITPSRFLGSETNASHQIGASNIVSPPTIMSPFVRSSNLALLVYCVAADTMCFPCWVFSRNTLESCNFWHDSSHSPNGGRSRELIDIRSCLCWANSNSFKSITSRSKPSASSDQFWTLRTCRASAAGRARTLENAFM